MKFKILLIAVFVSGLSASLAVAAPPPGKGKGRSETIGFHPDKRERREHRLGQDCKPRVSLVLKGVLLSVAHDSLVLDVRRANKHARLFAGKQATVLVSARTKIRRLGKAELSALREGDGVKAHVRACKTSESGQIALLARRIVARPRAHARTEPESRTETPVATTGTTSTASRA